VLSLLLCVATVVLWVRSYSVWESAGRVGRAKVIYVDSLPGALHLGVTPADPENEDPGPRPYYFYHRGVAAAGLGGILVGGKLIRFGGRANARSGFGWVVVPHWPAALLFAVPPAVALWKRRASWWTPTHVRFRMGPLLVAWTRRKPIPPSHCQCCGYDLRATPGRCPECGTVPSVSTFP
jgi:hypothetical protein